MIFLRPWWLILILIPFLFKLFKEYMGAESPWKKVIDEKLLPYLLIRGSYATTRQRRIFKTTLWILLSIAMAGPSWDKIDVPAHTYQPGTIIVLELGTAMTGSNLTRAQQKIYDILDLLKGEQVGLVLYDRYGYTAGPLTFDTDIIRNMVPYLSSSVLPEKRSDAVAGFEQAIRLLKNANIEEGRILFLTTGAFWDDTLAEVIQDTPHKIGILGIGPAEPHPIPREKGGFITGSNGQPLMVYLDPKKMRKIGAFEVMTPDDTDVQNLIDDTIPKSTETERLTNQNLTIWRDRGGILVAFLLPFFALMFRKSIIILLLLCFVRPAEAGLWLRPDQEEHRYQMSGVEYYRGEDYTRAEKVFRRGKDAEALYNKGNALAFQQKIPEAIEAYKEALQKDPNHADALYNKEYLEKEQEKEQEEQEQEEEEQKQDQQEEDQQEQDQQDQEQQDQNQEQQDQQDPQDQEQQNEENPQDDQNKPDNPDENDLNKNQDDQSEFDPLQDDNLNNQQDDQIPPEDPNSPKNLDNLPDDQNKPNRPEENELNDIPENLDKPNRPMDNRQRPQLPQDDKQTDLQKLPPDQKLPPKKPNIPPKAEPKQIPPTPEPKKQEPKPEKAEPVTSQTTEAKSDPESETESDLGFEPVFDQESEKVLNQLPPDEDNVLRYRIRQQYNRYIRN